MLSFWTSPIVVIFVCFLFLFVCFVSPDSVASNDGTYCERLVYGWNGLFFVRLFECFRGLFVSLFLHLFCFQKYFIGQCFVSLLWVLYLFMLFIIITYWSNKVFPSFISLQIISNSSDFIHYRFKSFWHRLAVATLKRACQRILFYWTCTLNSLLNIISIEWNKSNVNTCE